MSTGRKLRFSFVLRCVWPVLGMGVLLAVQAPVQAAPHSAYVANQGGTTVSVIDTATNAVTATITVGLSPYGVAVSPDGSRVYVANANGGTVSVIDTATSVVTATIPVGSRPNGVAASPDGSRVYVTNNGGNTVTVIDTATNAVTATIPVGNSPYGVAASPDGSRVYVANNCVSSSNCTNGTVSVIDTATDQVTDTSPVGGQPPGVAVSPDGSQVYVTNETSDTVSVIDTATGQVTATITVGHLPFGVAVSPDGSQVYVTNFCASSSNCSNGTVSVIDTATNAVTATITVGSYPLGVAASPDGSRVYVTNANSNTVSVIDTATDSVVTTITVGSHPYSLGAFVGAGALIATNSSGSGVEGQQISGTVPALTNSTGCATSDTVIQNPAHGSLVFDAGTGGYTYTPASATYVGPDAFTWNGTALGTCTAADNPALPVSNVATVTFTLTVAPPVASSGSVSTAEGQTVTGQLSATGPSGQTLTYALVTGPVHGTVTLGASTGVFTYTPVAGFSGTDAFTFDAKDSGGTSNTATETVGVIAPPVASGGSVSTAEGQAVTGQLNASAPSGQALTYALVTGPGHGTITLGASTGAFTYTPAGGFAGTDAFTFDAKDSGGTSNTATETVSVIAPPVASGGSVSTAEGQAVTGQLSATAPSGQTLTYALVTGPGHGTVTLSASTGAFTYTPAAGFVGVDSFTFDAKDSGGTSNTATEAIGVLAPPGGGGHSSGGGALGLDSLGMLGAGLFFSRSRRKKRVSPG